MKLPRFLLTVGLVAGLVPATFGQDKAIKPAVLENDPGHVHRLVIVNGGQPSIHYVGLGLSSTDQAALRELERTETELAAAERIQKYRVEIVDQETTAEVQRNKIRTNLVRAAATMPTVEVTQSFAEAY